MPRRIPEIVDGSPNLCGSEIDIEAAMREADACLPPSPSVPRCPCVPFFE